MVDPLHRSMVADQGVAEVASGLPCSCPSVGEFVGLIRLGNVSQRIEMGVWVISHRD